MKTNGLTKKIKDNHQILILQGIRIHFFFLLILISHGS